MELLAGKPASLKARVGHLLRKWSDRLLEIDAKAEAKSGQLLDFPIVGAGILGRPVFHVMSRRGGFKVGAIKWSNQWNKASFKPDGEAVFDQRCIAEIYAAMKELR